MTLDEALLSRGKSYGWNDRMGLMKYGFRKLGKAEDMGDEADKSPMKAGPLSVTFKYEVERNRRGLRYGKWSSLCCITP